jgi:hypothetical protein
MFSDQAAAFAGTPQELEGTGMERVVPPEMYGPPSGPFGFRVSMMRQGSTVINRKALL